MICLLHKDAENLCEFDSKTRKMLNFYVNLDQEYDNFQFYCMNVWRGGLDMGIVAPHCTPTHLNLKNTCLLLGYNNLLHNSNLHFVMKFVFATSTNDQRNLSRLSKSSRYCTSPLLEIDQCKLLVRYSSTMFSLLSRGKHWNKRYTKDDCMIMMTSLWSNMSNPRTRIRN